MRLARLLLRIAAQPDRQVSYLPDLRGMELHTRGMVSREGFGSGAGLKVRAFAPAPALRKAPS